MKSPEDTSYEIRNMTKALSSRQQRATSPQRHRSAVWVLGKRVLPNRPITITGQEYRENYDDIISRVRSGEIAIHRPDRVVVDSLHDGTLIYFPPEGPPQMTDPAEVVVQIKVDEDAEASGEVLHAVDPEAITNDLNVENVTPSDSPPLCIRCRDKVATDIDHGLCADCTGLTESTEPTDHGTSSSAAEETMEETINEFGGEDSLSALSEEPVQEKQPEPASSEIAQPIRKKHDKKKYR